MLRLLISIVASGFAVSKTAGNGFSTRSSPGWATNGPVVFRVSAKGTQVLPGPAISFRLPPENLPPEVRSAMVMFRVAANVTIVTNIVSEFDHYLPESLNNLVWTNFIAHTNGRSIAIWSARQRPPDWPATPVTVKWNRKSLIWGMKGMTSLSPSWEWEGPPGNTPITALTRRHGYARGHLLGHDKIGSDFLGKRVWFLDQNNLLVTRRIRRAVVNTVESSKRDYTLVLFDADLPNTIEPMRVVDPQEVFTIPHCKYWYLPGTPSLLFKTEQGGNVSADVPGFTVETMKGGDSGSPNMLPLPGELVFFNGRTTSGASPEMQADMDELCRLEGLDPANYRLKYVDLTSFPTY
jgi:hypothetical protein